MRCSSKDRWKTVVNKRSVFFEQLEADLALFESSQFRRVSSRADIKARLAGNPRCIPSIRRVCNRDDFYEPNPLTSSPTPIPSGVLCGDNSSLSYIVARRCRACAACARLSCRMLEAACVLKRFLFFFVILDRIAE